MSNIADIASTMAMYMLMERIMPGGGILPFFMAQGLAPTAREHAFKAMGFTTPEQIEAYKRQFISGQVPLS